MRSLQKWELFHKPIVQPTKSPWPFWKRQGAGVAPSSPVLFSPNRNTEELTDMEKLRTLKTAKGLRSWVKYSTDKRTAGDWPEAGGISPGFPVLTLGNLWIEVATTCIPSVDPGFRRRAELIWKLLSMSIPTPLRLPWELIQGVPQCYLTQDSLKPKQQHTAQGCTAASQTETRKHSSVSVREQREAYKAN